MIKSKLMRNVAFILINVSTNERKEDKHKNL